MNFDDIPNELYWEMLSYLEYNEICRLSRLNHGFLLCTRSEIFWKSYAETLHLQKMEEDKSWRDAVEKFFFTSSSVVYDSFRDAFSLCFRFVGKKNVGKCALVKNYFGVTHSSQTLKRCYFSCKLGGKKFVCHLEFDEKGNLFSRQINDNLASSLFFLCFALDDNDSFQQISKLKSTLSNVPRLSQKCVLVGLKSENERRVSKVLVEDFLEGLSMRYYEIAVGSHIGGENNDMNRKPIDSMIMNSVTLWKFYNDLESQRSVPNSPSKDRVCTIL